MHSWKWVLKETSIRLFWDYAVIKVFVFGCASWGGLVGTVAISFPSVRNNFITIITAFYRRGQAAFTGKTPKDLSFFTKHWFSSRLNFSLFFLFKQHRIVHQLFPLSFKWFVCWTTYIWVKLKAKADPCFENSMTLLENWESFAIQAGEILRLYQFVDFIFFYSVGGLFCPVAVWSPLSSSNVLLLGWDNDLSVEDRAPHGERRMR